MSTLDHAAARRPCSCASQRPNALECLVDRHRPAVVAGAQPASNHPSQSCARARRRARDARARAHMHRPFPARATCSIDPWRRSTSSARGRTRPRTPRRPPAPRSATPRCPRKSSRDPYEPHGRHRHCGVSPRSRVDGFPRLRQHVPGVVVVRLEQGVGVVRRERESRLVVLRQEARRTAEQRAAGVEIAAFEGSSPGRRETRGRATRESSRAPHPSRRARPGTDAPARGGSRRSRRSRRGRGPRATRRSARGARRGSLSAAPRRRRRG